MQGFLRVCLLLSGLGGLLGAVARWVWDDCARVACLHLKRVYVETTREKCL